MSGPSVRWLNAGAAALAASMLLAGCAVGPDFLHPAAPEDAGYTQEPLAARTASTDAPTGQPQRFAKGRDVPARWWARFKSPALNALIERALDNNPTLQSAIATLRAAREQVYAQEGKFFPLVQANFNPTYQRTSTALTPIPASGANIFALHTAQVEVSYTLDVWGLNRRTVESLTAQADAQRFQVEAAYLTLTANVAVAAITEASLRGQIDATNELIAINTKMLDVFRQQLEAGYTNRSEVAAQEAALAQVRATLPPLRKALAQQRDLLAALAGTFPNHGPRQSFKLADLHLPADLPVSVPSQLVEQRPDIRAAEEELHAASAQVGIATANTLPSFTINANAGFMSTALAAPARAAKPVLDSRRQCHADDLRRRHAAPPPRRREGHLQRRGVDLPRHRDRRRAERRRRRCAPCRTMPTRCARRATSNGPPRSASTSPASRCRPATPTCCCCSTAQQTYLQAVIQVVQARAARLADTVALFQALGGGWWNRIEPPAEKILDVGTGEATTVIENSGGP